MSGVPRDLDHHDLPHERSGPTRFAAQTSVEPTGADRFRAQVHPSWWIVNGPNGGYVAAIVLRAIVAAVGDAARRPRSITLQYLRAPEAGPVDVEVHVERSGRSVTNVSARMTQGDRLLVLALAALATDRPSRVAFDEGDGLPTTAGGSPVPMPAQLSAAAPDPDRDVPMRGHYDLRWVLGDVPFSDRPSNDGTGRERRARSGGWLRPAEAEPIDEVVLLAMSDAWVPPLFSRVDEPLAVPTIDLTVHFRRLPEDPLDHCFVLFDSPLAVGGYLVEHGRTWDRHGRLLAESRQLAVLA